jgi:hypothetical protein
MTIAAARMRRVMLIRTLYFDQAGILAAVVCSLIVAGLLKGIIGVGMPVVACPSDNICAIKLHLRHSRSWC